MLLEKGAFKELSKIKIMKLRNRASPVKSLLSIQYITYYEFNSPGFSTSNEHAVPLNGFHGESAKLWLAFKHDAMDGNGYPGSLSKPFGLGVADFLDEEVVLGAALSLLLRLDDGQPQAIIAEEQGSSLGVPAIRNIQGLRVREVGMEDGGLVADEDQVHRVVLDLDGLEDNHIETVVDRLRENPRPAEPMREKISVQL